MEQSFDFISDPQLQSIISRDYTEVQKCMSVEAYKSVLLLSGSIVESLLLDYFRTYPSRNGADLNLNNKSLNDFLEMAAAESVISETDKNLAAVIKNYRNFIHPSREVRSNESVNCDTAKISMILLDIIIKRIIDKQSLIVGYKATQIMAKLINDNSFQSIYSFSISKLNKYQIVLLFKMLVDYDKKIKGTWEELNNYAPEINSFLAYEFASSELECPKIFLLPLLSIVPNGIVREYLNQLVIEIETGNELNKTVSLFNLLDSQLDLLDDHDKNTVICYILDIFSLLHDSINVKRAGLFQNVGKYIQSDITKQALLKTVEFSVVNIGVKSTEISITNFKHLLSCIDPCMDDSICKTLQPYYEYALTDGDIQMEMRHGFFAPALKEKIISIDDSKISLFRDVV